MPRTKTKKPSFAELIRPYENKWIAIAPDYSRVVASGDSLEEVDTKVPPEDREKVILHRVLPFDAVFVPASAYEI